MNYLYLPNNELGMLLIDEIILGLVGISLVISLAVNKFKFDVNKILFVNIIIYPIISIIALIILGIMTDRNLVIAFIIDFVYSFIIMALITVFIFGLGFLVKKM